GQPRCTPKLTVWGRGIFRPAICPVPKSTTFARLLPVSHQCTNSTSVSRTAWCFLWQPECCPRLRNCSSRRKWRLGEKLDSCPRYLPVVSRAKKLFQPTAEELFSPLADLLRTEIYYRTQTMRVLHL